MQSFLVRPLKHDWQWWPTAFVLLAAVEVAGGDLCADGCCFKAQGALSLFQGSGYCVGQWFITSSWAVKRKKANREPGWPPLVASERLLLKVTQLTFNYISSTSHFRWISFIKFPSAGACLRAKWLSRINALCSPICLSALQIFWFICLCVTFIRYEVL